MTMSDLAPFEQRWSTPKRFRPSKPIIGPAHVPAPRRRASRPVRALSTDERVTVERLLALVEAHPA